MRFLLLITALLLLPFSWSQTNNSEINLEQAVKKYNEMRAFEDNLTPETLSQKDITKLYNYDAEISPLLNQVLDKGNESEKATARYFKACTKYELSFIHGMAGENAIAYPIMNSIKSDFDYYSNASSFPLRYMFEGKNYVINYTNFESTLSEYYTGFSEVCFNLGKYEEAIVLGKKSIADPTASGWYKYIAYNKLIDSKKRLNQIDAEYIDFIVEAVTTFSSLDTSYLSTIKKNSYPSPLSITKKLTNAVDSLPYLAKSGDQLARYARLVKANYPFEAADVYTRVLKLDQASLSNVDEALAYYKELANTNSNAYLWSNGGNTHIIVSEACFKMKRMLSACTACFYWTNLSSYFLLVEDVKASQNALQMATNCQKEADRQAKKANRKDNSEFGICLSAYPVPMIWGNFGGSIEFNFEKVALTVAATKIGHDKDYQNDFYNPIQADKSYFDYYGNELDREELYYDGSRINTSLKFFMNEQSDSRGYFSLNLGRVMKTYDPILTSIYDTVTTAHVYYGNIVAKEKKYTFFVGFGAQGKLSERWMIDAGLGIGVSMPKLTVDSPYFTDRYYFNSYMVQSSQDNKIGMSGYMNVSIGYYLFKP